MLKKTQVAVEYMILVGMLLATLLVFIAIFYQQPKEGLYLKDADDAVTNIAKAADQINELGVGSKKYVTVNIPEGVLLAKAENNVILIKMRVRSGITDIHKYTTAIVNGTLPTASGRYKIFVEKLSDGTIRIGGIDDTEAPIVVSTAPNGEIYVCY